MCEAVLSGGGFRRGNVDDFVALAFRQLRQIADREHQHPPGGGDGQQHIGLVLNDQRRHHMRVVRQGDQRFTGAVARHQIVKGADKTVAGVGGHQQFLIVAFRQHMFHGRARRQRELTGQRLTLATRRGQSNRINGIAAPGGIDKHHRLVALALRRGFPAVARLIA